MSGEPTPAQVANDLVAQARSLRRMKGWQAEAEVFERAAAAIRDLVATGTTRRDVWGLWNRLGDMASVYSGQGGRNGQLGNSAARGAKVLIDLRTQTQVRVRGNVITVHVSGRPKVSQ